MKLRSWKTRPRGAAAIEFAILLPLLVLIVIGTLEWGRYFTTRESVIHAAREGARGGTLLNATAAQARQAVDAYLSNVRITRYTTAVDMAHTITGIPVPPGAAGNAVQVTINAEFQTVTGLPLAIPNNIQVSAVMPIW